MFAGHSLRSLIVVGALLVPGIASAATAVATTNVNLRAGPSTAYPVVDVVRGGGAVNVHGCLSNRSWCDVTYQGLRGWMSSNYLAQAYQGQRYTGTRFVERVRPPVISFSFGNYWDRHYSGRQFYRDRERYRGIQGRPGRPPVAQQPSRPPVAQQPSRPPVAQQPNRPGRPPQAQPPRRDNVEQNRPGRPGWDRGDRRGGSQGPDRGREERRGNR